jgi:hypothetical protein
VDGVAEDRVDAAEGVAWRDAREPGRERTSPEEGDDEEEEGEASGSGLGSILKDGADATGRGGR